LHHKEIHISDRKSRSKEKTGTDRRKNEMGPLKKKKQFLRPLRIAVKKGIFRISENM
jgi:hypothetical protein